MSDGRGKRPSGSWKKRAVVVVPKLLVSHSVLPVVSSEPGDDRSGNGHFFLHFCASMRYLTSGSDLCECATVQYVNPTVKLGLSSSP